MSIDTSRDVPQAGISRDVPQAGISRDVPQAGISRDVPQAGISRDVPQAGISRDVPQAGISRDVPQAGISRDVPQAGISRDVPQAGISRDVPQAGIRSEWASLLEVIEYLQVSLQPRSFLALVMSLFCSPVLYFTSVNSCIVLFTLAQAGLDSSHITRCCSVIPRPLVRPPQRCTSTCSIIKSEDRPAHQQSLRLATCRPFMNCSTHVFCPCL